MIIQFDGLWLVFHSNGDLFEGHVVAMAMLLSTMQVIYVILLAFGI